MNIRFFGIAAIFALALTACPGSTPPAVSSVTVTAPSSNALKINEAVQFNAVAKDSGNAEIAGKTFTWLSSDPNIASVDANGMVTAKRFGVVTVTASVDGINGVSGIQTTFGLEAIGGTNNRPYITASATTGPITTASYFRFKKADGKGPTSSINLSLKGPSGWNGDAALALNNYGFGTPYHAWYYGDPVAVTGSYTLSTTIDGVKYSSSFNIDANDSLPVLTGLTPSAATASGVTGTWAAVAGGSIYRMSIQDWSGSTAVELDQRIWGTSTTATITGITMNTANPYGLVVSAFSMNPGDATLATTGVLPSKFNVTRNRANIVF
jgi:Bacterial Ig-like domain (group 2)